MSWIKVLQVKNKEANLSNYFQDMSTVIREIRNAKTPEDKKALAVRLRDLLGGI